MWGRAALLSLALVANAGGQVIGLKGGGASMYQGYGLAADIWGNWYDGWLGVGYQQDWRIGGFLRAHRGADTLRLGNDVLTQRLPTDVFNEVYHLQVQGATIQHSFGRASALAFGGASATGLGVPLFAARRADQGFGMLLLSDSVTRSIHVQGSTLLAQRSTTLGSVDWHDRTSSLALTAGRSGGAAYRALAGTADHDFWAMSASLIGWQQGFRRAALPIPAQTGLEGANAELLLRPTDWSFMTVGRHSYVSDSGPDLALAKANGSSASAGVSGENAHVSLGGYRSVAGSGRSVSAYAAAGWQPADWFGADGYGLWSRRETDRAKTVPVLTLHERVSQRLTLDEMITGAGRGMSVGLGGRYIGRFGDYAVVYQIVNDPFDAGRPFKRTVTIAAQLQLGEYNASVGSTIGMNGDVNYTASAARYLYLGGENGARPAGLRVSLDRYVVEGFVTDEQGKGIAGAAIRVGDEMAFTDSRGHFFTRASRRRPVAVSVAFDEFLVAGVFEVVSAPAEATPEVEGRGTPLQIVLRRH